MRMKQNNLIKISDLCLATVISQYFPIVSVNKNNPRRAEFIFEGSDELKGYISKFWEGKLVVEPKSFFNQIKNIKSMIYFDTG